MRKNARSKGDFLVQVTIGKTIPAELEFRRLNVGKVGVEDSKRIKFGDVMTSHLVSTNKKLDLREETELSYLSQSKM